MTEPKRKKRRPRGSGGLFQRAGTWYVKYKAPNGKTVEESTGTRKKTEAEAILQKRTGALAYNLPVIPRVEHYLFRDAAKAVIDDFEINGKKSLVVAKRRIEKHLMPYFGNVRLAGINSGHVQSYIAHRQKQGIERMKTGDDGESKVVRVSDVSNAEINRELQLLKRIFSLAIKHGRLGARPYFAMLKEANARSGFFEREQFVSVVAHLPTELQPVIEFAYITGWRIASEVLPLEWRQVDLKAGEVRLDPGTTKNGDGRVFPMTTGLRRLLEEQKAEHDRLAKAGHLCPFVFFREVAEGRGGEKKPQEIISLTKAWRAACLSAGCPGRIPHDLRRTAVRNLVRAGIPERVAMQMTGHKTRSVFERYNIVSGGDLKDAARKLDAANALATGRAISGR